MCFMFLTVICIFKTSVHLCIEMLRGVCVCAHMLR